MMGSNKCSVYVIINYYQQETDKEESLSSS
jgi:hypothetical protein